MLQASSSESPAPQSPAGSVFDSIWIELCRVYSRPQTTTRDYLEESLLSEISRRQNVAVELEIILAYRDRLPAGDKRFFPQSLPRLLERWQDTLDRARTYQPLTETRNPLAPKLADVQALCREKWGEDPRCSNWAASFFGFWSEPKRNWQRNGRPIDWKVELSAQVSRWKASPQN